MVGKGVTVFREDVWGGCVYTDRAVQNSCCIAKPDWSHTKNALGVGGTAPPSRPEPECQSKTEIGHTNEGREAEGQPSSKNPMQKYDN